MLNGILFHAFVDIVRRLVNHLLKNVYFLCDNNLLFRLVKIFG